MQYALVDSEGNVVDSILANPDWTPPEGHTLEDGRWEIGMNIHELQSEPRLDIVERIWHHAAEGTHWHTLIDSELRDIEPITEQPLLLNWYFAPLPHNGKRAYANVVEPVSMLWVDVDDGAPFDTVEPVPSVAWETSPGRYQAIWFLDRPLSRHDTLRYNLGLVSDLMGDEKVAWPNRVLRVPGSINWNKRAKTKVLVDTSTVYLPWDVSSPRGIEDAPRPWLPETEAGLGP